MEANMLSRLTSLGIECQAIAKGRLNHGGCAVYAALLGEGLKGIGFKVRARVLTYENEYYCGPAAARKKMKLRKGEVPSLSKWKDAGVDFTHVVLQVQAGDKWWLVDSEHQVPADQRWPHYSWQAVPGALSLREVTEIAYTATPGSWNRTFNRGCIRSLRAAIKRSMKSLSQPANMSASEVDALAAALTS